MAKSFASLLTFCLLAVSCQSLPPTQTPPSSLPWTAQPPLTDTPTAPPTPSPWDDRSVFKDGLVPAAQPILERLPGASVYHIEFNIESDLFHITGHEEVRYTNTEDVPLEDIQFRLFPNILGGEMKIENLTANGGRIAPRYEMEDSLMIVPLMESLRPGEKILLTMDFEVTVSESIDLNYGVEAFYDDVLALAHAYPMIEVYDDEGWNAEIPSQFGDVTYTDMSFFNVKVTASKNLILVAVGREISREEGETRQTVEYEAGPVRDFYLAASPEYEVFTQEMDGITLRFYTRDYLETGANAALDAAARAIRDYSARYAPYPYSELDFVSTPTYALGIEYPGMIAINEDILYPESSLLEGTVAHEVGHQWFYNLVGNDQLDDPWLDESLVQFVTLQYFTDEYGREGSLGFREDMESRWSSTNNADIPIGLPVASYTDAEYNGIVYGRGGLFFDALRDQIGEAAFDAFMRDYTETLAWDISTPEKLKAIAEEHCNCNLTALFEEWVY